MEFRFEIVDYIVAVLIMLISAGAGLYVSTVRHKQSSMMEYFVAGRNVPMALVLLSYFSSFAAGGMTGFAIETYSFGAQLMVFVFFITPIASLMLHHLIVPIFYRLQNISMLKYFEIRFGSTVSTIILAANIYQMTSVGTVNMFVSGVTIRQVTALTFWQATIIMAVIGIFYSTLGGMRGIVLTDAIQAVIMIVALLLTFIIGIVKSGGPMAIFDINDKYDRLQLFNWEFNPTKRHTIYSVVIGQTMTYLGVLVTNQTLLQRCFMAPNLKAAQRVAVMGAVMTFVYVLMYMTLGLVMFAFYGGCDVVSAGSITNVNQLNSYFAMEILHQYPGFPGLFFSGILCATLSTISSLLNSISALIMVRFAEKHRNISEKRTTIACKILVAAFGAIMLLGVLLVENFHNFNQAITTFISVISGPMFALCCIGILCPQANHKCVATSLSVSLLFGIWIILGAVMTTPTSAPFPFANCSTANETVTIVIKPSSNNTEMYFPLSKLSYNYISLMGFLVTVLIFLVLSIIFGPQKDSNDKSLYQLNRSLIPHSVQVLQMKMSKRVRQFLLCDVYDDVKGENAQLLN